MFCYSCNTRIAVPICSCSYQALCPFPAAELQAELKKFPNAKGKNAQNYLLIKQPEVYQVSM